MNFNPNRRVPIRIITVYHPPLPLILFLSKIIQNLKYLFFLLSINVSNIKSIDLVLGMIFSQVCPDYTIMFIATFAV